MTHCDDFSNTDLARRGLLDAPISRRGVLQAGAGAVLSMYAARATPIARVFEAAEADAAVNPDAPVLVSIFAPGGLDLLDTLIPTAAYGRYADLRPSLKVDSPLSLGSNGGGFGLHPSLGAGINGGLKGLFDRGRIGFLPGIDYANPDLSHFNSRHFWESGQVNTRPSAGWLARWIDRTGNTDNPFQGLSSEYGLSPLLRGSSKPVAAISSPSDAQAWIPGVWGEWEARYNEHYERIAARRGHGPGPKAVNGAARQSRHVAKTLAPYVPKNKVDPLAPPVAYPTAADGGSAQRFGDRLSHLAGMIALPLGIRVATVQAPGNFDTHDGQKQGLTGDLATLSKCLSSFQADLEARGIAHRVLTLVWTEFGRRPKENSSGGSDHGAGGIAWVMGTRARRGLLTPYPDISSFDRQGNLGVTVDFRTVYASLLEQWLGTSAGDILPDAGRVGRIALVA
jgi:uncharacterized protein (DUF1501 family)